MLENNGFGDVEADSVSEREGTIATWSLLENMTFFFGVDGFGVGGGLSVGELLVKPLFAVGSDKLCEVESWSVV